MRRGLVAAMLGGIAASFVAVSALAVTGFANGSFENGPAVPNPPGSVMLTAGSTGIPGWTVSAGSIDYVQDYWQASAGRRSIDLTGSDGSAGAISKVFATVPGVTYTVDFDLAGNPVGPPTKKYMTVTATGAAPGYYLFDTSYSSRTNMHWTPQVFTFKATAGSTTLTFASNISGLYGPALDNVRVRDNIVTNKEQCKAGGWQTVVDRQGNAFRNQGDCVSYVARNR